MITTRWLDEAARVAPGLFAALDANFQDAEWGYLRTQVLALQVMAHLEPLESYRPLEISDKAVLDPRQSTMGLFGSGKADLKQIALMGKSQGLLYLGQNARAHNILINAEAGFASIVFGPNTELMECVIQFLSPRTSLIVASGTTIAKGANLLIQEAGNYILVGDDTMWSNNVAVRTSDSHAVYDLEDGQRINAGRPVIVHRHVWIGRHSSLNMGTEIGRDAVVGQHSMTGTTMRGATSYLGNPAMPGKRGITWDRTLAATLAEASAIHPSRVRQTQHIDGCARIDALAEGDLAGLGECHALSRLLAADFAAEVAHAAGPLAIEAQRLRVWAREEARRGVNLPPAPR